MAKIAPSQFFAPPYTNPLADPLSPASIQLRYGTILDPADCVRLSRDAKTAQAVETKYKRVFREAIFESAKRALDDLSEGKELDPNHFDFQKIVTAHAIDSMRAAEIKRHVPTRMAKKKSGMGTIFEMWDKWRKGKLPKRQKKNAKDIKQSFLHAIEEFWKKNSEDFRRGDSYDMDKARDQFVKSAKIPVTRANLIVQTETSRYYNEGITEIYKQAEGVTHYLFVAIRDKRTTQWCTDFHDKGRDGLVYKKEVALTVRNTPPCHWNCRSQFLPLSPSNPKHAKLINDESRRAENNKPFPLPRGWNS